MFQSTERGIFILWYVMPLQVFNVFMFLDIFGVILQYTLDIVLVHKARFEVQFILSKLLMQVLNR